MNRHRCTVGARNWGVCIGLVRLPHRGIQDTIKWTDNQAVIYLGIDGENARRKRMGEGLIARQRHTYDTTRSRKGYMHTDFKMLARHQEDQAHVLAGHTVAYIAGARARTTLSTA